MYGALPGSRNTSGGLSSSSTFDLAKQFTEKAQARWWEKRKDEPLSAWQELSADGVTYYYNVETKESTYEKPTELLTPEEMDQNGEWYWIPHPTECFIPARITASSGSAVTAVDLHGETHTVKTKKSELEPLKRSSLQRVVTDLVLLDVMSAPLILHNLKQRFAKHEIYTNVGTILIAINPYCSLPLYTDEIVRSYARRKLGQEMPPHSFNIAHDAFVGLRDFNQNQSVIISGESGAGKTETTKHCLNYLAYMAGNGSNVAHSILKTNPILEAFGNAKTLRNDNSSRFGKYMQIFFQGRHCAMSGCMVRNYLLEKIRVVRQTNNERNFHIFYMLTKGADETLKQQLHLQGPEKYRYLSTCVNVDTIDDGKDWREVLEAFKDLGFTAQEQHDIFATVAAIAHLGNVDFAEAASGYAKVSNGGAGSPVALAAALLKIDMPVLEKGLVTKELRIRNQETTVMMLNVAQAEAQRDALAKFIYGYLFDWLVERLNKAIGQPADKSRFIGCLDIFGFEIFDKNSFEQLCINFTNEMLQQHFNYQTFKLEEAVYKSENITFKHIEFIDNQPMLDLINKRPHGLIPLLDEELVVPRGSDDGFLGKMNEYHSKNAVYKRNMRQPKTFMIKHYAGLVSYDVDGFLEKNRDSLTEDLVDVLKTSQQGLINVLFPAHKEVSTKEKKASLGSQFSRQLEELMGTLRTTEPHYIRCIKPNANKSATTFVPVMCNEQLTYSGVFEAVAIRKAGFPFRLKHDAFVQRYQVLFDNDKAPGSNTKAQCQAIIEHMKLARENVQMGTTMVLYRADEHKKLELHRNIKVKLTETQEDLERLINTNVSGFSDEDKEHYFIELAGAVRSADEFRLNTPTANAARKLLDKFVEERMDPATKRQLEQALVNKNMRDLEAVLRVCEAHGYQTSLVRQCQELLERITDAEAALRVAIGEANEEYLERAIAMCDDFGYKSEGYTRAMELKENMAKAKEMIRRSLASLNHEHLKKTIEFCAGFNYRTTLVEQCEAKYKQVMRVRALLEEARKQVDVHLLKGAVDAADELGYDDLLVYECRLLHGRIVRIDQEADRAMTDKIDKHIRAVLKAANEIGYKGKMVKKLKTLADGKPEEYLQQQYLAATKLGDHERAINLNVDVKMARVEARGDQLRLARCGLLKEPLAWGKEKWWGSSQWRADTMLVFTDVYVHAPLTRTFDTMYAPRAKLLTPKVLLCYENIQKAMGQRKSSRLPQRIEEILMESIEHPEIRDETYVGLMKFLTANPDQTAVARGWALFALCLTAFPPSADLEDFVMAFLLQPANKPFAEKYNMPYLLCRIIYLNAVARPFWGFRNALADVPMVLSRVMPVPRPEQEQAVVGWEDLKVPFHAEDYEERAREAYRKAKIAHKAWEQSVSAGKRSWEADMGERAKAAQLRSQGIAVSIAPPLDAGLDSMIPQQTFASAAAKAVAEAEPSRKKKPVKTVEEDLDEAPEQSKKGKKKVIKSEAPPAITDEATGKKKVLKKKKKVVAA